jgi:hypothetical protein
LIAPVIGGILGAAIYRYGIGRNLPAAKAAAETASHPLS